MTTNALQQFLDLCRSGDWVRMQFTRPPEGLDVERLQVRPVELKAGRHWQAVWKHPTKDLTENWPEPNAAARVEVLLNQGWRSAGLWTAQAHWQLDRHPRGGWKLVRHRVRVAQPLATAHNRDKPRALDLAHPVWAALGIAETGRCDSPRLVPALARKWKQINHFVTLFSHALADAGLPEDGQGLRVADFGCGRGYLTFAVALHLASQGVRAQVTGVELRDELVAQTETLARQVDLSGLHFAQGDVGHREVQPLDVMIALHACDTATDHAIHHGLRAGARVILCAPCCHKELRGQLQPPSALRPLFRHGIHLGQEAEMLTDGLRALWLEAQGYDTKVIEFVSLEHTQKNKMIVAVRRGPPDSDSSLRSAQALDQAEALKTFWQIREHTLERLLRVEAIAPATLSPQALAPK